MHLLLHADLHATDMPGPALQQLVGGGYEVVMPMQCALLQDKSQNSSNLKIPALTFLRTALESTDTRVWQQQLPVLSPAVFATVGERYYKVTAQGLRVAERLIFVIRPQTQAQVPGGSVVGCLLSWHCLHVQSSLCRCCSCIQSINAVCMVCMLSVCMQ